MNAVSPIGSEPDVLSEATEFFDFVIGQGRAWLKVLLNCFKEQGKNPRKYNLQRIACKLLNIELLTLTAHLSLQMTIELSDCNNSVIAIAVM